MRFVLIRHGQSGNNLLFSTNGDDQGRDPDTLLTPLGEQQAEALAGFATDPGLPWRITHLRCSLMARAIQTAAPLADALDVPLHADEHLHECMGPYDYSPGTRDRVPHPGSARSALAAHSPRLVLPDVATEDGWWTRELEEAEEEYAARAARVVATLRDELPADAVVGLVTHGWFTQYLVRELLGIPAMSGWFAIHNTAVTLLADQGGTWSGSVEALKIGWTPHLAPDQVSS